MKIHLCKFHRFTGKSNFCGEKKRLITDLDKYIKMTRIRNYVMSLYSLSKNGS